MSTVLDISGLRKADTIEEISASSENEKTIEPYAFKPFTFKELSSNVESDSANCKYNICNLVIFVCTKN